MNKESGHIIPVDLIARKLSGEATTEEIQELEKWISENQENSKIYSQYVRLWEQSGKVSFLDKIDIDEEWNKFKNITASDKPVRKLNITGILIRMAAAIFVGAVLGYSGMLAYKGIKYEKITAKAEIKDVNLPDGSLVTLNTGSQLIFPKKFNSDSRQIKLEGEAYFDVIRDSLKPFSVDVGQIEVRVLGTSFNIDARSSEDSVTVVVDEGKIAIFAKKGDTLAGELIKGEKAVVNSKKNTLNKSVNDNPNFNSYKTRKIIFDNSGFIQVENVLENVYNIEINVETPGIYNKRITVSFNNKDIDYVLKTIEATLDLEAERQGRIINLR